MTAGPTMVPLESLGALAARGRDALAFLQGQLSADLTQLTATRSLLAGYHNPQGRVLALLRLIELAPGEVLIVLPRELAAPMRSRLAMFVLRSKVTLTDESTGWRFAGLIAPVPPLAAALPATAGGLARLGDSFLVRLGEAPPHGLIATPAADGASAAEEALAGCQRATPELWSRLRIAAGEPEVYVATSGEFVAQMLNLDALGGIAFDKGCYTGQEVIARAHYRGRVKRRLQRFRTAQPLALAPGDLGELADGRTFRVVDAVRTAEGGCEFLAVAPLAPESGAHEPRPPAEGGARVEAVPLPLPYALPD
jgi:tRNA-modifying protein YgfZ